ncbi:MAG: hypothetical protein JW958_10080 [Candidatus Eisenbacteria bacterium]|nr:hypothetical protein [Candidatus Eisenbacteria bacterium]
MRRWFFLTAAFSFALALAFFPGCGGDDDDNPAGGGGDDTLTAEEIFATVEDFLAPVGSVSDECPSMYMLNEDAIEENMNEMFFMLSLLGADIEDLYGTWTQTGTLFDTLAGMERTSASPANAVKILMTAADTMGTLWPGDITIYEFDVDTNLADMNMDIRGAIHLDDFADSAYLDLSGHIATNMEDLGDLDDVEVTSADVSLQGVVCDFCFLADLEMTGADSLVASGWYDDATIDKTYFEATLKMLDVGEEEVGARGTFSLWTTVAPAVRFDMVLVSDPDTCVTGDLTIAGKKEASFFVTDCSSEEPGIWIVIDGVVYDAEEYMEDLLALIEDLEGAELPGLSFKNCCH